MSSIKISQTPKFYNGRYPAIILFFIVLILVLSALINLSYFPIISLIPFAIAVFLFIILLDIHGVEINKRSKLIRYYKLWPWGKKGIWHDLNQFDKIYLKYETYTTKTFSPYSRMTNIHGPWHSSGRDKRFLLYLQSEDEFTIIHLGERDEYVDARKLAYFYSRKMNLPVKELIRNRKKRKKRG